MLKRYLALIILVTTCLSLLSWCYAAQSTITEAVGYACMGDDKSRKQTEHEALTNAKRNAIEYASTYIKSETSVKNLQLEKDLVEAYARAAVRVIQKLEESWYKDASSGECFKLKIKAEVIPDDRALSSPSALKSSEEPDAPLNVRIWTDKKTYRQAEKVRIYIKGNKPFYACIVHKDAEGKVLQLLPNPLRKDNYFNGGIIYEVPSGKDQFELEVNPPFGEEHILVYASLSPLGDLSLQDTGHGVYKINNALKDVGLMTRGIKLQGKGNRPVTASEFFESKIMINTKQ